VRVLLGGVCQMLDVDNHLFAIFRLADALHMSVIEGHVCHTHNGHRLRLAEATQHWCVNSLVAYHEGLSHLVCLCVLVVSHECIIPSASSIVKANR